MWNPDPYLEKMYADTKPEFSFCAGSKAEWKRWHEGLKKRFIEALGGFPQRAEPNVQVLEETRCDGYLRQRIELNTFPGLRMPMYVLIPSGAAVKPLPAVIACHGHGYGSREIVGLPQEEGFNANPTYQRNFAVELVKRGFLVAVPELLGFGDRRLKAETTPDYGNSCHRISTYLIQFGYTMAGHRVYEVLCALDYLTGRPDTDCRRIGCMGISGGGLVAAFTAALDERIQAAVISGYVNLFKESILSIHHCVDNYVPGLSRIAEMPDLVGLIAPRPLLVEAGLYDNIFPIDATRKAFEQLRSIYRLLGEEPKLASDFFPGEHRINGEKAYEWLGEWLI
jgi:dienelactone hydrolase